MAVGKVAVLSVVDVIVTVLEDVDGKVAVLKGVVIKVRSTSVAIVSGTRSSQGVVGQDA